jgi:hypothetical protein
MEILGLLALLLIIGALRGGKDVPESIRLGCGCLVGTTVFLVVLIVLLGALSR